MTDAAEASVSSCPTSVIPVQKYRILHKIPKMPQKSKNNIPIFPIFSLLVLDLQSEIVYYIGV